MSAVAGVKHASANPGHVVDAVPDQPWRCVTCGGSEDQEIARMFHEAYERLAPLFSYETRKASARPWTEVPENNRQLMAATVREVFFPAAAAASGEQAAPPSDNEETR